MPTESDAAYRNGPMPADQKAVLLEWIQSAAPCRGAAPSPSSNPVPVIGGAG
jgi:hypothetical protein